MKNKAIFFLAIISVFAINAMENMTVNSKDNHWNITKKKPKSTIKKCKDFFEWGPHGVTVTNNDGTTKIFSLEELMNVIPSVPQ